METPIQHHRARMRAAGALGAWCAGILLVRSGISIHPGIWFAGAGLALTGSVALRMHARWIGAAIILSLILLSAGWTTMRLTPSNTRLDRIVQASSAERYIPIRCRGRVVSRIQTTRTTISPSDPPRLDPVLRSMRVAVNSVYVGNRWVPAEGQLRVVLPTESPIAARPGGLVTLLGTYRPPGEQRNPGDPDWNALAIQKNQVGSLYIEHSEQIEPYEEDSFFGRIAGAFFSTRAALRTRAFEALDIEDAHTPQQAVMGALILGHRDPGFNEVYQSFQRIGIAHMLAISGFHIAVILGLCVLCVRILGEHPRLETATILFVIGVTIVLLPLRPPVLRAIVIVLVLLGAGGFGRRYDRLTVLLWVAIGLLLVNPLDLFSLGYQLSFGITALLLVLPNRTTTKEQFLQSKQAGPLKTILNRFVTIVRANTACWVVATPSIMLHAGVFSPLAPIATLVMLPVILVLMLAGYIQLAIGMLLPAMSESINPTIELLAQRATQLTIWIDTLPGSSVRAPNLGSTWTLLVTGLLAFFVLVRSTRKARSFQLATIALVAWGGFIVFAHQNNNSLRIDMLDVGNGSCFIIRSGNESVLFDAGSLDRRIERPLESAAHALGARPIRTAFISHDNLDHFNALLNTPITVGLRRVYTTDALLHTPSRAWISIRQQLESAGVEILTVHAGDRIPIGRSTAEILWPPSDLDLISTKENNTSLVICWSTETPQGTRTILTTGDIESETMNTLLTLYPDLHADILELPHHGSPSLTLLHFLDALDPSVVLQSTGRSRLNDPRLDSVRTETTWFTTADRGAAWAAINKDGSVQSGWSISD